MQASEGGACNCHSEMGRSVVTIIRPVVFNSLHQIVFTLCTKSW